MMTNVGSSIFTTPFPDPGPESPCSSTRHVGTPLRDALNSRRKSRRRRPMGDDDANTYNYATTDSGAPAPSIEHSLTIGPDGPILLQDHYLIEQMANFNRERIPERQPHANGGGALAISRLHTTSAATPKPRFSSPERERDYWPASPPSPVNEEVQTPGGTARVRAEVLHPEGNLTSSETTPRSSSSETR